MDIKVFPGRLGGTVRAIPSKSQAHRALICAALADKPCFIGCHATSEDITATAGCLSALGANIRSENNGFHVTPIGRFEDSESQEKQENLKLYPRESGSTFRFLLPIVAALPFISTAEFQLEAKLPERPLSPLYEELVGHGCVMSPQGSNPFRISGQLTAGDYTLDAAVSSQFVSGLLFALSLLDGESRIQLTGAIESAPYIDLTLEMLEIFGVEIAFKDNAFTVSGGRAYTAPEEITVEGDWSNAAFWLCAGVNVTGLSTQSKQGDKAIASLLEEISEDSVNVDARDIPDLVPILSAAAAVTKNTVTIRNAGRLRLKESDRIQSVYEMLKNLNVDIETTQDGLIIRGGGQPIDNRQSSSVVTCQSDHRIAMSAAIAATFCREPVIIKGAEAVNKSYPTFFDDFKLLGGRAEILKG